MVLSPFPAALSLREQILPVGEIPMAEYDHSIDLVVTPDGVIGDVQKLSEAR
jgi:5-formyltetrahydrofolate cyclo-ligase